MSCFKAQYLTVFFGSNRKRDKFQNLLALNEFEEISQNDQVTLTQNKKKRTKSEMLEKVTLVAWNQVVK